MSNYQRDLTVVVHHDADHLWAEVEELPGCFAAGETMDELWEVLTDSIATYLSDDGQHYTVELVDREQRVERQTIAVAVCA